MYHISIQHPFFTAQLESVLPFLTGQGLQQVAGLLGVFVVRVYLRLGLVLRTVCDTLNNLTNLTEIVLLLVLLEAPVNLTKIGIT